MYSTANEKIKQQPIQTLTTEQKDTIKALYRHNNRYKEFVRLSTIDNQGYYKDLLWIPLHSLNKTLDKIYLYPYHNYYITANSFKIPNSRQEKDLFSLHNIVIDIDVHNCINPFPELKKAEKIISTHLQKINFPLPNSIHWTGRGLQL